MTRLLAGLFVVAVIAVSGCTTTKTESGGVTTTTTAVDNSAATQAAITAATQIATTAAEAAIKTYLESPTHARTAEGAVKPLDSAKLSTEDKICKAEPTLPRSKVKSIVRTAYAKELRRQIGSQ